MTPDQMKAQAEGMRAMMARQTQEHFSVQNTAFPRTMNCDEHDLAFASKTSFLSDPAATGNREDHRARTASRRHALCAAAEMLERASGAYESQVASIPNHKLVHAEKAKHFVQLDEPAPTSRRWTSS